MSLGCYIGNSEKFTIFYLHRFEGQEVEPPLQLKMIEELIRYWNVDLVGCDYGGGFDRNDALSRIFGRTKIVKYQYSQPKTKVKWEEGLRRFLVNRTEVMSDIFAAIKRGTYYEFPDWKQFEDPYAADCLSIFSQYSETLRQVQYCRSPSGPDDTFHSILLCTLASMLKHPRFDILNPTQAVGVGSTGLEGFPGLPDE